MTVQAFNMTRDNNGAADQESPAIAIAAGEGLRIRFTSPGVLGSATASLKITANGVTSLAPINDRDNFVFSPGEVLPGDQVRIVAKLDETYSAVTGVMETF